MTGCFSFVKGFNMADMRVVNQVVTTDLKQRLNLEDIATKLMNIEYNPDQFPGLVIRIRDPRSSALLFSSGRVVCTGTKHLEDAKKAVQHIAEYLNKIGIKVNKNPVLSVQNIVGSGGLGFKLNLNKLAITLRNTEYEPQQFPGLVYKIKLPFKASFLLFSNGKLVCTGTKSQAEMEACVVQLEKDLKKV